MIFYWGKMYIENIKQVEDYAKLQKVITINILDFEFLGTQNYQSSFHLWEDLEKDYMLTDVIEVHFLELPKFRRKTDKNFRENAIERWLAFLEKDIPETTLKELISMEPAIEKAENKLQYLSSDEDTMRLYLDRERSLHERANMVNSAEERGGNRKAIEIARNLINMNIPLESIIAATGLTMEEINKLK